MRKVGITDLLLLLIFAVSSANAATQIKIATLVPEASSWGTKINEARAAIKEQTDGRVVLKVYFGGIQGHAAKIMQKMKIGQLHGGDFTPTDFQDKMPDLNLYGLPFVFDSMDEVNYVRERMDETLAAGFADQGYVTFGFAGDFAIILSNNPVRGLDDLRGRKIWLPEGDAISDRALKKLQLVPNSKPISDVMTGLKTGLFDVVAIPPAAAVLLQWHTAVSYLTDMPVIYAMQFMAIQKRVFDKLSAEDQQVMREVLTQVYAEINEQAPIDAANAREALANSGITIVEPNAGEFERIQKVMAENNQDMAKQGLFSLELLNTMQQYIDEYRSEKARNSDGTAAEDAQVVADGKK
jgi:TRAP-type C4-dicarboxylate transport system substrate-binding protein